LLRAVRKAKPRPELAARRKVASQGVDGSRLNVVEIHPEAVVRVVPPLQRRNCDRRRFMAEAAVAALHAGTVSENFLIASVSIPSDGEHPFAATARHKSGESR
jgi:hypothetical protein